MAISVLGTENFTATANASSPQYLNSLSVPSGTNGAIVVVTIYDTSATDGDVSQVRWADANSEGGTGVGNFTEVTQYYDATCGGHVSIWYINNSTITTEDISTASGNQQLQVYFGGTVTDFMAGVIYISVELDIDSTATPATGNGSPLISWYTSAANTITVCAALSDQPDGTKLSTGQTSLYIEDVGNDTALANYMARTVSGLVAHSWTDADNNEDWVAVATAFYENTGPTSSVSAYLTGPVSVTDNQSAFMVGAVGQVYRLDVEEGDLTDFTGTSGDVSANATSPLLGSYDLSAAPSPADSNDDYAYKTNTAGMVAVSLRFYVYTDTITLPADTNYLRIIQGRTNTTPSSFLFWGIINTAGTKQYYLTLTDDTGSDLGGDYVDAPTGDNVIEIHLVSETYDGANDGYAEWWINGTKQPNRTNWSQNYNVIRGINQIDYGNNARTSASVSGVVRLDDIILRDDGAYIGFDPVNTSDSQSAYTEGASAGTNTSDNQAAYLKGQDTASDNQSAYTEGQDTALSNKSAFLCGIPSGWQFLFHDGFESNDTSAWTSETDPNSELTTSTQSAMGGTYGMQIIHNDADDIYLTLDTADNIIEMQIEFMFDPNDADENDLGETELFYVDMPSWTGFGTDNVFGILYNDATDGPPQLRAWAADGDDGDKWHTTFHNITQGPNKIRVVWDGTEFASPNISFYVDDTFKASLPVAAYPRKAEILYLGIPTPGQKANTGTLYFDQVWIFVKYSAEDNQSAYLKGQDTASDNQAAFLQGSIDALDNQTVYLKGQDTGLDNTSAYLDGATGATDNQSAYLAGQDTDQDNQPAYLAGSVDDTDSQSAYLSGSDTAADSQLAYLSGSDTASDNQPVYMIGSVDTSDTQSAYVEGDAVLVTDSQWAYVTGQDTAVDSQLAFLQGKDTAFDTQPAYLIGSVDDLDSQTAYMQGSDTSQDSQSVYLIGSVDVVDSQLAYLDGQDTATDNQRVFTQGQDTTTDSQPAYLLGALGANDSQWVYIIGQDTALDTQSAFLSGSIDVLDNQSVYLQGQDTTQDQTSSFLIGQDIASDSTSAYLAGSIDVTSSSEVYISGQDTSLDSQPAYMAAGLSASDSQPVYMLAAGEWLIPDGDTGQSGSWKREDESSTNLYASIDEDTVSDSDYVYHATVAGTEYFEVSLSNPGGASIGAGDVMIYWRGKRMSGGDTVTMRVQLREGTTTIAQSDEVFTGENITYSYTLSSGEKSSITDWNNLRLRFIVQGVV